MPVAAFHKPRLRLRSILLMLNLLVLVVPLGSIYIFRLYENELVRETESELIAQGSYISALYKHQLAIIRPRNASYGTALSKPSERLDETYNVILPQLDLSHTTIQPPRPDAEPSNMAADPYASKVAQYISPIIEEANLSTLAGVRLTDYRGIIIGGKEEQGLSLAHIPETAQALGGQYMSAFRKRISSHAMPPLASISRGTDIRIFVAMPIIDRDHVVGTILLSRSPRSILKGLYDERQRVAIAGGIILLVTILLALLTSRAISRPIHAVIAQTQQIAREGKHIPPIHEPMTQELALLSQNIADMAQTIATRSDYIRNFAMHVSHEFKTPLTSIQGAIELIQEHGNSMTSQQMEKFLNNITNDSTRLTALVSRLLDLAKADVIETRAESFPLKNLLPILRMAHPETDIYLTASDRVAMIPLPEDITHTIFGNLIENSVKHGATRIAILYTGNANGVQVIISDNGSGISAANAEKLFTPFFTTRREEGGTGLGLSIIRSLLSAYKAEISCRPKEDGACFEIQFSAHV
jgi:signal transduction histidine kinase